MSMLCKRVIGLSLVTIIFICARAPLSIAEEEITLTTIMPGMDQQDILRKKKIAIGVNYKTFNDADVADNNLIVEGNVGVGTQDPTTMKGNTGIIDTDDVWLRSTNQWVSTASTGAVEFYNFQVTQETPVSGDEDYLLVEGTPVRRNKLEILTGRLGEFETRMRISWSDTPFTNVYAVLISGEETRTDLVIRMEPQGSTDSAIAELDSKQPSDILVIGD